MEEKRPYVSPELYDHLRNTVFNTNNLINNPPKDITDPLVQLGFLKGVASVLSYILVLSTPEDEEGD